jgi:hypothetical protein
MEEASKQAAMMCQMMHNVLLRVSQVIAAAGEEVGSSSSSQVTASVRLLLVLVVVHNALEAAAAAAGKSPSELLAAGVAVQQRQRHQLSTKNHKYIRDGRHAEYLQPMTWQQYQDTLLQLGALLLKAMQAAVKEPTVQQQQQQRHQPKAVWPYLLQLRAAPKLVKAVESMLTSTTTSSSSSSCSTEQQQQVENLLAFCGVAIAAVPLPEVCNNPSCQCCDGLSEAAAATKVCSGCGTRYCSRQCQEGDWRQHKAACKRLRG